MADETNPTTQAVDAQAQGASATENQTVTSPAAPEPFDAERAKATILAQRESEEKAKKEAKALREQLKDYERLKADEQKRIEAQMSETERLKKQADELAATNAKLQADILRRDVIVETGLPAALADRLKGTTKEEMLADAKELLKVLPPTTKQPPHIPPTNPNGANTAETEAQKRERIFGSNRNIFDANTIREAGGGVVWNKPEK